MIATLILAVVSVVIGVAVLAAPVLDLILFGATLPSRFAAFRADRAAKRASRMEPESQAHPHDRDWHA